jgi:hypothetical protein
MLINTDRENEDISSTSLVSNLPPRNAASDSFTADFSSPSIFNSHGTQATSQLSSSLNVESSLRGHFNPSLLMQPSTLLPSISNPYMQQVCPAPPPLPTLTSNSQTQIQPPQFPPSHTAGVQPPSFPPLFTSGVQPPSPPNPLDGNEPRPAPITVENTSDTQAANALLALQSSVASRRYEARSTGPIRSLAESEDEESRPSKKPRGARGGAPRGRGQGRKSAPNGETSTGKRGSSTRGRGRGRGGKAGAN